MTECTINHRKCTGLSPRRPTACRRGEAFALCSRTGCFPDLVLDNLAVGESPGNLAPSLRDIARTFQEELHQQLTIFRAVLSYGVLFCALGFVTLVAVAIVLAVFQVSASFKF